MRTFTVVDALDLAAAYAAARYGVRVDVAPLSLRVGERATELERQWPAQSYMFITAWNPASNPRPDDANHAADALLTARLDELGIARRPAWAESPDGQWHEPGWLLAEVDDTTANQLGLAFGQAAILVWASGEPVTVRMLISDPRTGHVSATGRRMPANVAASVHWSGDHRDIPANA